MSGKPTLMESYGSTGKGKQGRRRNVPEERQRKSIRVGEIDKMIETLESLERVDKTADYHKRMAIAYLKNFADCLDDKGVKTIKVQG